jgi:hypothetical protein
MMEPADLIYAQQLTHADVSDKIDFVYELQVKLRWFGPESLRDLAEIWNVGVPTVTDYCRQARARVIAIHEAEFRERSRAVFRECEDRIRFIASDALRNKKGIQDVEGNIQLVPDKKHAVALACESLILKLYGVASAVAGRRLTGAPSEEDLSNQELEQLLEQGRKIGIIAAPTPTTNMKVIEYEAEGIEVAVPGPDTGRGGEERIRSGRSRRDRDPTGQGRGKGQAPG